MTRPAPLPHPTDYLLIPCTPDTKVIDKRDDVRSRSLRVYRDTYAPPLAPRLSGAEFGYEDGLKSVPLYAAFCLTGESVTA